MHGVSRYKVPEGKLVEIRLDYDDVIEKAEMLGDFFLYPEESISKIESGMVGMKTATSEKAISEKIRAIADSNGIEMIGITPEAIARAVKMAVEG